MFYTEAAVDLRERASGPIIGVGADTNAQVPEAEHRERRAAEHAVDSALADSFPASDPPSWTLGVASPQPPRAATDKPAVTTAPGDTEVLNLAEGVIDVSRLDDGRTFFQSLLSLAGAAGIALLVPLVILIVGLPIVLAARGIVGAISWLVALIFG